MLRSGVAITYNGELYNVEELRSSLFDLGHRILSRSDTELVLISYLEWGKQCLSRLEGMFSFAIWDSDRNELFLARDRFGEKPLYYARFEETLFFASEISALVSISNIDPNIDRDSIDHFLARMYVPPWRSIYSNISQIPPSHYAIFRNGHLEIEKYYNFEKEAEFEHYEGAKSELRELLKSSVRDRIRNSDVEVALFLSGGVDSSLVCALSSEVAESRLKAFTVDYGGAASEAQYARHVSDLFSLELIECSLGVPTIEDLDLTLKTIGEPHADSSNIAQLMVSRCASQYVKVVLSGDGADELFLGYPWHERALKRMPQHRLQMRLSEVCVFDDLHRQRLWGRLRTRSDQHVPEVLAESQLQGIDRLTFFDLFSHLPGQILTKVDRLSMRYGLEVRAPFLDSRIASFAFGLPIGVKRLEGTGKIILRDILSDLTDHSFAWRPKQGFGAPHRVWLRTASFQDKMYQCLGSGAAIRSIFDPIEVDKVIQEHRVANDDDFRSDQRIWSLLCLERWLSEVHSDYR